MTNSNGNNDKTILNNNTQQYNQIQWGGQQYVYGNMNQQSGNDSQINNAQQIPNEQQIYMNQQMYNQMIQQQEQLMRNNQYYATDVKSGYVPGEVIGIRIRNKMSLIAAIVCMLSFFVGNFIFVSEWHETKGYSLGEFSKLIEDWPSHLEGFTKILCWFSSLLSVFLVSLIIISFIGAFANVNDFREWAIGLTIASIVCTILWMFDDIGFEFISRLGTSWLFLIAGIVLAIISKDTDASFEKVVPRRELGNGVSDSKLDLSSINRTNVGEWRCPSCDTKNNGSTCKVCGISRP